MYNYLYAKKHKGQFILRVEDTDRERCKKEYEISQLADLAWLGIHHDEGPDKNPGYRQSERLDLYQKYARQLVDKGLAYYAFDTDEELSAMKERAVAEKRPPHYEGIYKTMPFEESMNLLASGKKGVIRFRAFQKNYVFFDQVRKRVAFKEGMVGDFIIMRSNGMPVYNFCCVVDDWQMNITHVLRAEEHLPNTLRQLMLYEALDAPPPQFAHMSLLVGKDRQKLSKRHGAASITSYRKESYLPEALINYLSLLGHSHPEGKDIFDKEELIEVFRLERLSKAPALFDPDKCKFINGQHLRKIPSSSLVKQVDDLVPAHSEYHNQSDEWKKKFVDIFIKQTDLLPEISRHLDVIFSTASSDSEEFEKYNALPSTALIREYIKNELDKIPEETAFLDEGVLSRWLDHGKKNLKIKGKPLFMGMRVVLTGREKGPELSHLLPMTPFSIIKRRLL